MSTETPSKGHRHTRSAATPSIAALSHNPQNPHYLNSQSYAQNSQSEMSYPVQPTTPPRTPRKDDHSASQNKSNSSAPESGSKHKPRNKNRPKNVNVSPAVTRNDRRTPPLSSAGISSSAKPMATPSTAAYAGPTFHASPAPSALPIPSFYSKSVPDSPGLKGLQHAREVSLPHNSTSSTPPAPTRNNEFQREESPLDFFFKADREEKARARSASSAQNAVTATGPFQPPTSPRSSQTPPAAMSQSRQRYGHANRSSGSGMFAFELDGPNSPGSPYGPAFSTPYSERINAARIGSSSTQPPEQPSQTTQQSIDRSELLKAYLFSGHQPQVGASTNPQAATGHSRPQYNNNLFANDSKAPVHTPRMSGRSSGLRQEVTPTKTPIKTPDRNNSCNGSPTPSRVYRDTSPPDKNHLLVKSTTQTAPSVPGSLGVSSDDRSADLQGMEDSLRKILKLDSVRSPGTTGPGIGSAPAAATAVSVPNYVGGRHPPMNGMHNGVMGS